MAKTTPVNHVKTDPLCDHYRINLSNFINDQKNFGGMKEKQDKAAIIYKKMMGSEKELKDKMAKGPIHIQQMPSRFSLQEFTAKTKDNHLTEALRENFDKGITHKAAWDYLTLKQSAEEFEKLKQTPVNHVKTDPLYDHYRINLSNFINDPKNFGGMKEKQDKAAIIYQKMMGSEKELKDKKAKGPTYIQQMPSTFSLQEFTAETKDNHLTVALREHFHKGITHKASWDYLTLKQSAEELEKLKQNRDCSFTSAQTSFRKCVFCDNNAVFFCYQCKAAFCQMCRANYHDKLPVSKDHSVKDLKSVNPSAIQLVCSEHKDEYTYYCVSCKTLVCSTCVTTAHTGHEMSEIKRKAEEIKKIAKSKLSNMKEKLQRLSKLVEKTKTVHIPHLDGESGDAIESIRKIKADLDKILQTKVDIKINEIEDSQQWRKEELQSTYHNKERTFQKQTAVCDSLETLLSEEHAVLFLTSYQTLERDLHDLTGDILEDAESKSMKPPDLVDFLDDIIFYIQEYKKGLKTDAAE